MADEDGFLNLKEVEDEVTEDDLNRLYRAIPSENLSRYLSYLGRLRQIIDTLSTPEGSMFLGRINKKILECENYILSNTSTEEDSPKMKEMKVRFKVYKEEAEFYLGHVEEYKKSVRKLKEVARASE